MYGRGLRGSNLEHLLEFTNAQYLKMGLARVDKIATPVKAVEITDSGVITRGFYEKKSTVDFIGIIQGMFVAFDTKEIRGQSLPLKNIHEHQLEFMKDVAAQGGLCFIILHFVSADEYYLIDLDQIIYYMEVQQERKSIPYSFMKNCIGIDYDPSGHILMYIDALNTLLSRADL